MNNHDDLIGMLNLQPIEVDSMSFTEFLRSLKDYPERGLSSASVLLRAIQKSGEVDIDNEPVERRPYLQMLKEIGIKSYKAFDAVKGSQKTVARIMNHLSAAAANGYQLHLALVLKGAPGSGKSFLSEVLKDVLEGQIVYCLDGCPVQEHPLNLLNLLDKDTVDKIAASIGLDTESAKKASIPSLKDMLVACGQPCKTCWSKIMEGQNKNEPNLGEFKVKAMRISSRKFGIGTWLSDEDLANPLRRGSRGLVSIPEMFSRSLKPTNDGSNGQLDVLLTATNDRRIAYIQNGSTNHCHVSPDGSLDDDNTTWLPLDAVIIGETNDGEYEQFIKNHPDPNKFTRRFTVYNVPYNTSVSEEELAYREFLAKMPNTPHFDPVALKMLALFAVISRLQKSHEVDIVSRARMYDGEKLIIEKKNTGNQSESDKKSDSKIWTVGQLWAQAGETEGMSGLSMPLMLSTLSQLVEISLKSKVDEPCVASLDILNFLRAKIKQLQTTPGLTDNEKEVYKNCEEFLEPKGNDVKVKATLETEYRRILRRQLLEVIQPNFDERATEIFEKYRAHANAFAQGLKTVETVTTSQTGFSSKRNVEVDVNFLSEIEGWMGFSTDDLKIEFRRSLEAEILSVVRSKISSSNSSDTDEDSSNEAKISWRTITKLAQGITAKLNNLAAIRIKRILKPEIELSDEDKQLRAEVLRDFEQLGYCKHCLNKALTYFKDYQLWNVQ